MSKVKTTVGEAKGQCTQDQRQKINPYDAIVATLDGETMGRPHVQMADYGRSESTAVHRSKQKKAA